MRTAIINAVRSHLGLVYRIPYCISISPRVMTPSSLQQLRLFSCTPVKMETASELHARRQVDTEVRRSTVRRTGNLNSTYSNAGDRIERNLLADGHRVWGLAVYRCTYTDDAAWKLCIERIHAEARENMEVYNGHDLLEGRPLDFRLTVFDDANRFDGAKSHAIRRHFNEWRTQAIHEEQGSPEEIKSRQRSYKLRGSDYVGMPVRYRYCVQVDEDSMRSILSGGAYRKSWVNLINADWESLEAARQREQLSGAMVENPNANDDEWGEWSDMDDEEYPAIEGCTEEDVGWMRVPLWGLTSSRYADLRDPDTWGVIYYRPPGVTW